MTCKPGLNDEGKAAGQRAQQVQPLKAESTWLREEETGPSLLSKGDRKMTRQERQAKDNPTGPGRPAIGVSVLFSVQ